MNRIRRDDNEADLVFGRTKPPQFRLQVPVPAIERSAGLHVHESRWAKIDPDCKDIRSRRISAKLYVEGHHAGSFRLDEYKVEPLMDKEEFFFWLDTVSSSKSELGSLFQRHWDELWEVTDYGTVLEFERAWMNRRWADAELFGAASKALLGRVSHRAILVLKAYPLEYESRVTDANADAQRRRQLALMRLYRSVLGVDTFPGSAGNRGWMFAIPERLRDVIRKPCYPLDQH